MEFLNPYGSGCFIVGRYFCKTSGNAGVPKEPGPGISTALFAFAILLQEVSDDATFPLLWLVEEKSQTIHFSVFEFAPLCLLGATGLGRRRSIPKRGGRWGRVEGKTTFPFPSDQPRDTSVVGGGGGDDDDDGGSLAGWLAGSGCSSRGFACTPCRRRRVAGDGVGSNSRRG